jgi:hypothetical protein
MLQALAEPPSDPAAETAEAPEDSGPAATAPQSLGIGSLRGTA